MPILYEKSDHIVVLTINRPEALNAFDPETFTEMSEALVKFRDDPDAWVGILTGAGQKAFSAGADLRKLIPAVAEKSYEFPASVVRGLSIWKPLIAAVNGMALGGGLEFVLACDLRIAAENATFGNPEVRWAIIPGWGATQRLPRFVPWAKAAELILMGTIIDAKEAYRIGLVNKVVPLSELMPTAREWAAKICENGPLAVQAAKQSMVRGSNMSLEDGLALEKLLFGSIFSTEDAKEGLKAFAEKRKPEYKGR